MSRFDVLRLRDVDFGMPLREWCWEPFITVKDGN